MKITLELKQTGQDIQNSRFEVLKALLLMT